MNRGQFSKGQTPWNKGTKGACKPNAGSFRVRHPGGYLNTKGYIYVQGPNGRPVGLHRIVAAAMLGRPLRRGEIVHHINGDKTDNRPENLRVYRSGAEHFAQHDVASRHYGAWRDDEIAALRAMYPEESRSDIEAAIPRHPWCSIKEKAQEVGIARSHGARMAAAWATRRSRA